MDAAARPSALPSPAEAAVDEQAAFGASAVKVVLNADAGPVFDAATLAAVVAAARRAGLPVAVHAEGAGMAALAIEAGVDALVHTPWTEAVPDALLAAAAAAGQRWVSTLDIQGRGASTPELACAIDNLARFRAAGGTVLYGTDLGNGELPAGVNPREIAALVAAGLEAPGIVAALTDPWPAASAPRGVSTFVPGEVPASLEELPAWLASAVVVPSEGLDLDPDAWGPPAEASAARSTADAASTRPETPAERP
ncbi:hydrolase [Agromyces archimandritae]|uniref:Hydrolase n=1 Tax=Agromyces archimandritae TaxID=2781962 RepID=A0A975FQF4_9MICO|nr:hydrolase [Agromyces archimandritae]QTX05818.1 hydrolase [Agromyces archimandritae]